MRYAKAGAAAERPCDEARRGLSPKRSETTRREGGKRQRLGRVHGLNLLVETLGALDRLAHVLAALVR